MSEVKKHIKQQLFFKSSARTRWIFGGNRTGKTHAGACETVWWATGTHPYNEKVNEKPRDGWVVSLSSQVQRDVAQEKILCCIKDLEKKYGKSFILETVMSKGKKTSSEYGVIDFIVLYHFPSGGKSRIGFKNCEQGREKFQGTSLDFVWFDEEPTEDIFDECLMRTLDRGGNVWGTMTPLKGRTWVYNRIYSAAESVDGKNIKGDERGQENGIGCISMTWDDNPFLCESEKKSMERHYSKDALESRKYGRFIDGTGLVYPEFCEKNVILPFVIPKGWYTYISIDPGFREAMAVLWLAVSNDGVIHVIDEYVAKERSVSEVAMEIITRSERIGVERNKNGRFEALIDSAATQVHYGDTADYATRFRVCGIDVNPSVDKSVLEGIHRIKGLLCETDQNGRGLVISSNCENLIAEMRGYLWGNDNKPIKKNDHCLDALRYFVNTVVFKKQSEKLNNIGRHKKEILKRNKQ